MSGYRDVSVLQGIDMALKPGFQTPKLALWNIMLWNTLDVVLYCLLQTVGEIQKHPAKLFD